MGCTKWTTTHLQHIAELLRQGLPFGQIARETSISKSVVARFANHMKELDFDKSLGGRPPPPPLHAPMLIAHQRH